MRALLVTVGSHGDIHPFIAVGRALMARGHSVAILTNPYFAPLIRSAGLEALDLGEEAVDLKDLIAGTDAMHHRKGL